MENKCETIGKYLMPLFRSMVAKELVNTYKLTQIQTSEVLGTTQAAVSQYIHAKRAIKCSEKYVGLLPTIQSIASQTAEKLTKKEVTWKDVTQNFCNRCSSLLEEDTSSIADNYSI
jgi:predicted transcriptional regulator